MLVKAYFDNDYDIEAMMRVMFNSDFFKSAAIRYEKVKGPAEFVVGVLRLTGEFDMPRREMVSRYDQITWMGQELNNPPSVEGWHQGTEWVDTGTLIERINFASEQFGDTDKPGVKAIIDRAAAGNGAQLSSEQLVDLCLDQMGAISVSEETHRVLVDFAEKGVGTEDDVAQVLRLTAATKEFQRA